MNQPSVPSMTSTSPPSPGRQTTAATLALLALAASLAAVFQAWRAWGLDRILAERAPEFIGLALAAGMFYIAAVYLAERFRPGGWAVLLIAGAAVVFRLQLLPLPPSLSDDIYRYQWEGRIERARLNPYTVYPDLPGLRAYQDPAHPIETGRTVPTVYPPLSERAFAFFRTIAAYKLCFTVLDLANLGLILVLLRMLRQPLERSLVYAWNPMVIVSFAMDGHYDSLAVFLLLAANLFIIARRRLLSVAFLALAVLAKFFPVLLLPAFLAASGRRGKDRADASEGARQEPRAAATARLPGRGGGLGIARRGWAQSASGWPAWGYAAAFAAVVAAGYLPFAGAGRRLFTGLADYAAGWEGNDSVFRLLRLAGNSKPQAELIAAVLVLALVAQVTRYVGRRLRRAGFDDPEAQAAIPRACLVVTAGVLLLSPNAFPWYFTWSIPFLCFELSPPWLLMSVTAALGYAPVAAYAAGEPYVHSPAILALEYVPVYAWLAVVGWRALAAKNRE